jgi:hypothetical protein
MSDYIEGGFILLAKRTLKSGLWEMSHLTRSTFITLLLMCEHNGVVYRGQKIERGQCVTTYEKLREKLRWRSGYRWKKPSYAQVRRTLNEMSRGKENDRMGVHFLDISPVRLQGRLELLITIPNYDKYQRASNYDSRTRDRSPDRENDRMGVHFGDSTISRRSKKKHTGAHAHTRYKSKPAPDQLSVDQSLALKPDFVDLELWSDFMLTRESHKSAVQTERAIKQIAKLLVEFQAKGWDANAAVRKAIIHNWASVYPPKGDNNGHVADSVGGGAGIARDEWVPPWNDEECLTKEEMAELRAQYYKPGGEERKQSLRETLQAQQAQRDASKGDLSKSGLLGLVKPKIVGGAK